MLFVVILGVLMPSPLNPLCGVAIHGIGAYFGQQNINLFSSFVIIYGAGMILSQGYSLISRFLVIFDRKALYQVLINVKTKIIMVSAAHVVAFGIGYFYLLTLRKPEVKV